MLRAWKMRDLYNINHRILILWTPEIRYSIPFIIGYQLCSGEMVLAARTPTRTPIIERTPKYSALFSVPW